MRQPRSASWPPASQVGTTALRVEHCAQLLGCLLWQATHWKGAWLGYMSCGGRSHALLPGINPRTALRLLFTTLCIPCAPLAQPYQMRVSSLSVSLQFVSCTWALPLLAMHGPHLSHFCALRSPQALLQHRRESQCVVRPHGSVGAERCRPDAFACAQGGHRAATRGQGRGTALPQVGRTACMGGWSKALLFSGRQQSFLRAALRRRVHGS